MRFLLLATLVLFGCTQPPAPTVRIVSDDAMLISVGMRAVQAWSALGFTYTDADTILDECEENWTDDWSECQLTFTLVVAPGMRLENTGDGFLVGYNNRATRIVRVDTDYLSGDHLQHTLTHELGHSLLYCDHLNPSTQHGIMDWHASWLLQPTQDDYDLACQKVGLCYTGLE